MLNKSLIPVQFIKGMNTTEDEFVSADALLLDNIIFNKIGKIEKRHGFAKLANLTIDNTELSNLEVLGAFKKELVGLAKDGFFSYYDNINRWRMVSNRTISSVVSNPLIRNTANQINPICHTLEGVTLTAWEDSRGGVRYTVIDELSGQPYINDKILDATGKNPKIVRFRNVLYLFWITASNVLKRVVLRPSAPTLLNDEIEFEGIVISTTNPYYDITFRTETFYIISYITSSNDIKLGYYTLLDGQEANPNPNKLPSPIIIKTGVSNLSFIKVRTNFNNNLRQIFITYGEDNQIKLVVVSDKFAFRFENDLSGTYPSLLSCGMHTEGDITKLVYHVGNADPKKHSIHTLTFNNFTGAIIHSPIEVIRSVGLLSEPFIYDTRVHVIVSYESNLQASHYVYDVDNNYLVGRMAHLIGGGHITQKDKLTSITLFGENNYLYVGRVKTKTSIENETFFSTIGLYKYSIDLSIPRDNQVTEIGENLFITSSIPLIYDGRVVTEASFNISPEDVIVERLTGGGALLAGEYRYVAVYRWEDNQGQIHRSQPSFVETITAVLNDSARVTIPTLQLTRLEDVVIEIYRTEEDGSILYLLDTISNNKAIDTVSYVDIKPNSDIIGKELLYTTGGVLNNDAPEGCTICTTWQNRLLTAGSEDLNVIYYSKESVTGVGTEFSSLLQIATGTRGGVIKALKTFGDHLIVFKENSIGIITGKGATPAGTGFSYEYNFVTDSLGCRNNNAIAQLKNSMFFKSSKGFYRMNQDTSLEFIGTGVKEFREQTITSAVSLETEDIIIFGTNNGRTLVFNSLYEIWTTWTNYEMVSATNRLGEYYFVSPLGEVYKKDAGYSDNGVPIQSTIKTSWLSLAKLSGTQRLYALQVVGQRKGNHSIQVDINYDFRDYQNDTYTHDDYNQASYGDKVYGELNPYGGEHNDYLYRVRPSKQKCTSFQIVIRDLFKDNIPDNSFSLSAITLEVGVKKGLYKVNKDKKATTTNK